jgi:prepilin-type N-terminal cleavage/methylation domain-containing protein
MPNRKAFTLIEILIVITIIGILAVAFLPSLLGAPARARDAERIQALGKINNFLTLRYAGGFALPYTDSNNWDTMCIKEGDGNGISTLLQDNIENFGGIFPADPKSDNYAIVENGVKHCQGGYIYHNPDPAINPCGLPQGIIYGLGAGVEVEENATSDTNPLMNDGGGCGDVGEGGGDVDEGGGEVDEGGGDVDEGGGEVDEGGGDDFVPFYLIFASK